MAKDVPVTNVVGTVASSPAALSVNDPVAFTLQPADLTLNPGAAASFTVAASGTGPLAYQWKKERRRHRRGHRLDADPEPADLRRRRPLRLRGEQPVGALSSQAARLVVNPTLTVTKPLWFLSPM